MIIKNACTGIYTCTGIDKSIWRKQDYRYPARLLPVRIPPTMNDQDKAKVKISVCHQAKLVFSPSGQK